MRVQPLKKESFGVGGGEPGCIDGVSEITHRGNTINELKINIESSKPLIIADASKMEVTNDVADMVTSSSAVDPLIDTTTVDPKKSVRNGSQQNILL